MAEVAIVTACYGGYDTARAQAEQDIDVDWLFYTDRLDQALAVPPPWTGHARDATHTDPRLAAKVTKAMPWSVCPHRWVIWIDANMAITSPSFAREALDQLHDGLAVYAHPDRDCIYTEAHASLTLAPAKYAHQPILEQVAHYRQAGWPEHAGLYACGVIARDTGDPRVQVHGRRWWAECEQWTTQDQLSFPIASRAAGIQPGVFDHPLVDRHHGRLANRWLTIGAHLSNR
jgi:hypothetical protein